VKKNQQLDGVCDLKFSLLVAMCFSPFSRIVWFKFAFNRGTDVFKQVHQVVLQKGILNKRD